MRAFPKPYEIRKRRQAIRVYDDGREVCNLKTVEGKRIYVNRIERMAERQCWLCCICGKPMTFGEMTFEHSDLRGMGGARRNDRIWTPNGRPINGAAHGWCNARKGSVR